MINRSRILQAAMIALTAWGCGPTESTTDKTPLGASEASFGARAHIMPFGAVEKPGSATATPSVKYYGGPVISNVNVYAVYWNSSVNYQSQIPGFFSTITAGSYFQWLTEYDTPTQSIGYGTFAGSIVDTGAPTGKTIDDTAIQAEVARLINAGTLPNNASGNNLFMFYFPPGVTVTMQGSKSCEQFCAYHSAFQQGSQDVFYGVIPNQGGSCAGGCGNGATQFDNTTSVSSHELVESVTDGAVGLATSYASPLAWYDKTNGEIADICNAQQDTVEGYTVQLIWSTKQGACVDSLPSGGTTSGTSGTTATSSSSSKSSSSGTTGSTGKSSSSTTGTTGSTGTSSSGTAGTTTGTVGTTTGTTGTTGGTNLLTNGNFEDGSLTGWQTAGTPKPSVETYEVFDGKYSGKLGDDAARSQKETAGDSYIYQEVTLPSSAAQATLSFTYRGVTKGTDASDTQSVQIYALQRQLPGHDLVGGRERQLVEGRVAQPGFVPRADRSSSSSTSTSRVGRATRPVSTSTTSRSRPSSRPRRPPLHCRGPLPHRGGPLTLGRAGPQFTWDWGPSGLMWSWIALRTRSSW